MTHFSLPSRPASHVESAHTWDRNESDAIRRERCSLFPRRSRPSAKGDRVVTNDPHFSEAKDLRATWIRERAIRIRGTLIGADDGSSRRGRHIRLDLPQEFGRVGHPEMLDDLAAGNPVHVDRPQRDAFPRGRHPVERPGVGALESADGHDLVALGDDVVVHVPTVRERVVQLRETTEEPGPVESGHAGRAAHEPGGEEVALDLQVAFSIEFQHDRLVAFDGGRLPHLEVGFNEPATVGAGYGGVLTGTFDSGNRYPPRRLRRDPWMRRTSRSLSPSTKMRGR